MDDQTLEEMYAKGMERAPRMRQAILRAAKRPDRTATLAFTSTKDNPFLLYSAWGFARAHGVTLVLPPADADNR